MSATSLTTCNHPRVLRRILIEYCEADKNPFFALYPVRGMEVTTISALDRILDRRAVRAPEHGWKVIFAVYFDSGPMLAATVQVTRTYTARGGLVAALRDQLEDSSRRAWSEGLPIGPQRLLYRDLTEGRGRLFEPEPVTPARALEIWQTREGGSFQTTIGEDETIRDVWATLGGETSWVDALLHIAQKKENSRHG